MGSLTDSGRSTIDLKDRIIYAEMLAPLGASIDTPVDQMRAVEEAAAGSLVTYVPDHASVINPTELAQQTGSLARLVARAIERSDLVVLPVSQMAMVLRYGNASH